MLNLNPENAILESCAEGIQDVVNCSREIVECFAAAAAAAAAVVVRGWSWVGSGYWSCGLEIGKMLVDTQIMAFLAVRFLGKAFFFALYPCMSTHTHTHSHTRVHVCTCVYIYIYIYTHVCMCVCAYIHIYIWI